MAYQIEADAETEIVIEIHIEDIDAEEHFSSAVSPTLALRKSCRLSMTF